MAGRAIEGRPFRGHWITGPTRRTLLATTLALLLLAWTWWWTASWYRDQLLAQKRAQLSYELAIFADGLLFAVNGRLALLEGLWAFVQADPPEERLRQNFEGFAAGLYRVAPGIRAFTVAPDGINSHVYPLAGNEARVGYDLTKDDRTYMRRDVERAMARDSMVLTAPYELRQGGLGLQARKSVHRKGNLWGLVTMVVDVAPLLEETGLTAAGPHLQLALLDTAGNQFFGDASVLQDGKPVVHTILLPEGSWTLAGLPAGGWDRAIEEPLMLFQLARGIALALVVLLVYLGARRQDRLQQAVLRRARELAAANLELLSEIDERRRTEEALQAANRALKTLSECNQALETAGRVASQVAHDFANLLNPLLVGPELIRAQLPPQHPVIALCDLMVQTAERMVSINSDLMALGRRGRLEMEPINLNQVVREALRLLDTQLPQTLEIRLDLTHDLLPTSGAPAQLLRVVTNLISNARDAMNDDGLLTIRTDTVHAKQPPGHHRKLEDGEYVRLRIEDTGSGIPPEIRDRIFDPFFTTKRTAGKRGSGLGLAIVRAIVEDHRGYVDLESEVGKGTVFTVCLPAYLQATQAPGETPESTSAADLCIPR